MSLYRQLSILITTFLVVMITILLWFVLNYNKNLIENQLASNAKNSSSFLALSISKNVDLEDKETMKGMINSIVDNGFYEYVSIFDADNQEIVSVSMPKELNQTPLWFSNIFSIDAPSSTANIMKGWTNSGFLEVKIHQDYANNQIWITFKRISQIFVILTIIILVIFYFFLNRLLKPLKKLSIQAKAIDNNEFIIEQDLPNTIEFKNVTNAMNTTIKKMETIFNKEVETLGKYNELLYKDEDTGLGNKNYLILKLNSYLKNSYGVLIFFDMQDEISLKKKIGFKNYITLKKYLISKIEESFSNEDEKVLVKLNDGVVALLLPNVFYDDIYVNVHNVYNSLYEYLENNPLTELFDLKFSIGASNYVQNTQLSNLLSKTDKSLLIATQKEEYRVNYEEDNVRFSKQEWIELLQWSIKNKALNYEVQNILDVSNNTSYMKEYYIRLIDEDNNLYLPGDFLSIAKAIGCLDSLEKLIIEKIIKDKVNDTSKENIVINLSSTFISNKNNITWLTQNINKYLKNSNKTIHFECINAEVINNLIDFKYFVDEINKIGHKFAIESFTFDNKNLDYLKILRPEYLKISKFYLLSNEGKTDNLLMNITSAIGAYLVVKHVETKDEYEKLKDMEINYLQGKYIDEIEVH